MKTLAPETSDWLSTAGLLANAVFELTPSLRFSALNPGRIFGYPAATLLGTIPIDILMADDDTIMQIFAAVRDDGAAWRGQVTINPAHGSPQSCHLAVALRPAGEGRGPSLAGLLIDLAQSSNTAITSMPRQLDPETSLWTAASFTEQAGRRFDRLDVETQPGTLLLLGFLNTSVLMQAPTAMRLADELRDIVRPTDLLGRIDATTIALWCDGMDHLTGAERAARFCKHLPAQLPDQAVICAGLVTRWPGSTDDPATMISRAFEALHHACAATVGFSHGAWRVWQSPRRD